MTVLRRVPASDHAWLIASLRDALEGGDPLQPIAGGETPVPQVVPDGAALIIHTSGSSGVPKFVAHSVGSLIASAEATNDILGGPGQWLVALPTHLIAGLQMLTRSIIGGTTPLVCAGSFDPARFVRHAANLDDERRYTSLVPVQLAALMRVCEEDPAALSIMRRFDAILLGGQAARVELRAKAHSLGLNIVRTYGMTETGGGVVYDGVEIGETEMRIRDGEIQLSGPSLALGYAGDEALTQAQFIWDRGVRWYRTGDAGSLLGGMLQVTGRLDRVIISGGVNVSLDLVEEALAGLHGWENAVALGIDSPEWGTSVVLVKPAVTTTDHPELTFDEVRAQLRGTLGPAAVPVMHRTLPVLPVLASGKIDYRALDALLQTETKDDSE